MKRYYFYRRNHWEIGVDAIDRKDADQYIRANATGAKYIGYFVPAQETTATGAVTAKRQRQIMEKREEAL